LPPSLEQRDPLLSVLAQLLEELEEDVQLGRAKKTSLNTSIPIELAEAERPKSSDEDSLRSAVNASSDSCKMSSQSKVGCIEYRRITPFCVKRCGVQEVVPQCATSTDWSTSVLSCGHMPNRAPKLPTPAPSYPWAPSRISSDRAIRA